MKNNDNREGSFKYHFNRGDILLKMQKYEEAIDEYNKSITLMDYYEPYNSKAVALFNLGRYIEALESVERAINLNPNYAEAYNSKGLVLIKLGHDAKAIESYDIAIRIKPDLVMPYMNKGVALTIFGRHTDALEYFREATKLEPSNSLCFRQEGSALLKLARYQEAVDAFEQSIRLNPNDDNAHVNKGGALLQLKKYFESVVCFDKAIELNSSCEAYFKLRTIAIDAMCKLKSKNHTMSSVSESKDEATKAALFYCDKMIRLEAEGQLEKAEEAFSIAYELEPYIAMEQKIHSSPELANVTVLVNRNGATADEEHLVEPDSAEIDVTGEGSDHQGLNTFALGEC